MRLRASTPRFQESNRNRLESKLAHVPEQVEFRIGKSLRARKGQRHGHGDARIRIGLARCSAGHREVVVLGSLKLAPIAYWCCDGRYCADMARMNRAKGDAILNGKRCLV